jgi:transposase
MARDGNQRKGAAQRLARRRQRARQMREDGMSYREIAKELGVSVSTVYEDLKEPKRPGPPPPPRGNRRAESHGAHSRVPLADLATKYRERAMERWPFLTQDDVETWALLAARHELAVAAELEAGIFEADGRVRDVTNKATQWGARLRKLTLAHDVEAGRRAAERGRGVEGQRDWGPLARLADGPHTARLVVALRGQPWGDVVSDPVLMGLARAALAEMERRPWTPDPPEPEPVDRTRPALNGRPGPLGLLPPAPADRAEER